MKQNWHVTKLEFVSKSVPDVIKTTSSTFLKTSESEESIEHNIVFIKKRFHPRFVKEKLIFFVNFDQIMLISTILTSDCRVIWLGFVLTFEQSFI